VTSIDIKFSILVGSPRQEKSTGWLLRLTGQVNAEKRHLDNKSAKGRYVIYLITDKNFLL
jgi:hypothetical protein